MSSKLPEFVSAPELNVETELHYISVLHYIIFSFASDQAFFLAGGHGAVCYKIMERYDLRSDKAALKITVYLVGKPAALLCLFL